MSDHLVVPDVWEVRDAIDDHIRSYRDVRERGAGNAQRQANVAICALQGLRIELFGDVLAPVPFEGSER